jgi:hypothetical protein
MGHATDNFPFGILLSVVQSPAKAFFGGCGWERVGGRGCLSRVFVASWGVLGGWAGHEKSIFRTRGLSAANIGKRKNELFAWHNVIEKKSKLREI